jgi:hypothetical protein
MKLEGRGRLILIQRKLIAPSRHQPAPPKGVEAATVFVDTDHVCTKEN